MTEKICHVEGCGKKHFSNGVCSMHYHRIRRHGSIDGGTKTARFVARNFIDFQAIPYEGEDCLFWPFNKNKQGQPQARIGGKSRLVTRFVCESVHGSPPSSTHHAAHSCGKGNLGCVNPRHLRWATPKENNADKPLHGTHVYGEKSKQSKLTDDNVRFIMSMKGKMRVVDLASMFGVSSPHICHLQKGRFWKHITCAVP